MVPDLCLRFSTEDAAQPEALLQPQPALYWAIPFSKLMSAQYSRIRSACPIGIGLGLAHGEASVVDGLGGAADGFLTWSA
jgi:hypothetical protein